MSIALLSATQPLVLTENGICFRELSAADSVGDDSQMPLQHFEIVSLLPSILYLFVFLGIDTDLRSKPSHICWGQNCYRREYNHPLVKTGAIKRHVRSLDFLLTSYKVSTSLNNTLFIFCQLYLHHSTSDSLLCFDGKTKHRKEVAWSTLVLALHHSR